MKINDLLKTRKQYKRMFYVFDKNELVDIDDYDFVNADDNGDLLDCIIYFLCDKNEIVYVGQSTKIPSERIGKHYSKYDYSKVVFMKIDGNDQDDLNRWENTFIDLCKPALNGFLTVFEKSGEPKAKSISEIIEWNKKNNNSRRRVGRPRTVFEDRIVTNVAISKDLYQKMKTVIKIVGPSTRDYVERLVKKDLDANYDKYHNLLEQMESIE